MKDVSTNDVAMAIADLAAQDHLSIKEERYLKLLMHCYSLIATKGDKPLTATEKLGYLFEKVDEPGIHFFSKSRDDLSGFRLLGPVGIIKSYKEDYSVAFGIQDGQVHIDGAITVRDKGIDFESVMAIAAHHIKFSNGKFCLEVGKKVMLENPHGDYFFAEFRGVGKDPIFTKFPGGEYLVMTNPMQFKFVEECK